VTFFLHYLKSQLCLQDQTADALEHVLSRGSLLGVGFNPEAALRGNRGWPIVARMARVADVEAVRL